VPRTADVQKDGAPASVIADFSAPRTTTVGVALRTWISPEFAECGVAHSDRCSKADKSAEVQCPIGTSAPSGATKCVSLRTKQEIVAEQIYVVEKNKACVSGLSGGQWVR